MVITRSKGIIFSVLLRRQASGRDFRITLLTACRNKAVRKNIRELTQELNANDILVKGRKICGILTELKAEADRLHYLVVGIGLNVHHTLDDFPLELKESATSIFLENDGQLPDRKETAREILREMDSVYREYLTMGAEGILEQWKALNITLGRKITIKSLRESFAGRALDVDKYGALTVPAPEEKETL